MLEKKTKNFYIYLKTSGFMFKNNLEKKIFSVTFFSPESLFTFW